MQRLIKRPAWCLILLLALCAPVGALTPSQQAEVMDAKATMDAISDRAAEIEAQSADATVKGIAGGIRELADSIFIRLEKHITQ